MMNKIKIFLFLGILFFAGSFYFLSNVKAAGKKTVLIAAASNLKFALDDLVRFFEQKNPGIKIKTIYGSSGIFFNQILNGAPFDLYFSADNKYPDELEKRGYGKEAVVYAEGRLVLMAAVSSGLDVQKMGFHSLLHPGVMKIAIANPAHAPYGRAAVALIKDRKLYEKVKEKLVMGENIAQAAQFVESGAAELGLIALSLALKAEQTGHVSYWEIPDGTYTKIEQEFIILNRAKNKHAAREFTNFVQSKAGKDILMRYGFDIPEEKSH